MMEDIRMKNKFRKEYETEDGSKKVIYVKRPNNDSIKEADIHRAKVWNRAFKEGVLTKKEVETAMRERGLWDDEKSEKEKTLTGEILSLEKILYTGKDGKKKPKLSEGRTTAIEMRSKRTQLRKLIEQRLSMDENTAESLADNARFDYLVSCCSYYEDTDESVFPDYEDYNEKSSSLEAIVSAQLLALMMYNLEADFEDQLPENKFLKDFELVNEDGMLVDPNDSSVLIDTSGRKINVLGHFLDDDGNRIDTAGARIDDEGFYEIVDYEDDLRTKPKTAKKTPRKRTAKKPRAKAKQKVETTETIETIETTETTE
jgi:hypothetical protein